MDIKVFNEDKNRINIRTRTEVTITGTENKLVEIGNYCFTVAQLTLFLLEMAISTRTHLTACQKVTNGKEDRKLVDNEQRKQEHDKTEELVTIILF